MHLRVAFFHSAFALPCLACACALALGVQACTCEADGLANKPALEATTPSGETELEREAIDLLAELRYCEVRHRGLAIDTGSSSSDAHRSFHPGPFSDVQVVPRAGHQTAAVSANRIEYDFWLERPTAGVRVALRAEGRRAARLSLFVDDGRLGEARLVRDESRVFEFGPVDRELAPGRHTLTLRFNRSGNPREPVTLIDWIRVHLPDDIGAEYAAPTRANIVQDVEIGGEPRRSLSLRTQSSVRCGLFPGRGARVEVDVGYWGEGRGDLRLSALIGHQKSVTLADRSVTGDDTSWTRLNVSLDAVADQLIALDVAVLDSSGTGRVVFGEPRVTRSRQGSPPVSARNVVLVVVSGLARDLVPPWAERKGLQSWFELSEQAVLFEGYRVSSTLVGEVMASLLTGRPGSEHGLVHTAAGIREGVALVSRAMREIGGRSALFTNVPYTFEGYGFGREANEFVAVSPVKDLPAHEPLLRARSWLESEIREDPKRRRLLVVHLRGAHPPFDLTPEQANALPPTEYAGILEPRRAAILLRGVRDRDRRSRRRLGPRDWERLVSMQRAALEKQDAALGKLFETLKRHEQWSESLIIVMGDVGRGDPPDVPFDPHGDLGEDRLNPPLLVKLPEPHTGARRVSLPVGTLDVSRAIYEALGLSPPRTWPVDLVGLAAGRPPLGSWGIVAVHPPSYVFNIDRHRMSGRFGETPILCDLEVDPACQQDLYAESPFQMEWLWRMALRAFRVQGATDAADSPVARIDDDTRAALTVFGL